MFALLAMSFGFSISLFGCSSLWLSHIQIGVSKLLPFHSSVSISFGFTQARRETVSLLAFRVDLWAFWVLLASCATHVTGGNKGSKTASVSFIGKFQASLGQTSRECMAASNNNTDSLKRSELHTFGSVFTLFSGYMYTLASYVCAHNVITSPRTCLCIYECVR